MFTASPILFRGEWNTKEGYQMSHAEIQRSGVYGYDRVAYNGKSYSIPIFRTFEPVIVVPKPIRHNIDDFRGDLRRSFNRPFDLAEFLRPRRPASIGTVPESLRAGIDANGLVDVLDLPIKFPGTEFRLPRALRQIAPVVQMVANAEFHLNEGCFDEYYCYLTIDQGFVGPGELHREAPVHVDGFQGARWNPKHRANHSYTVGSTLGTRYYPIPFDFTSFDVARYNAYWEMNAAVADDNAAHSWCPGPWELTLMDCYCAHRGVEATERTWRTWLRFSFETRAFDRLGNAHNPLFRYAWNMVERDIEQLGLAPKRIACDPSLRVFPWQALDGTPLPKGAPQTRPNLTPRSG